MSNAASLGCCKRCWSRCVLKHFKEKVTEHREKASLEYIVIGEIIMTNAYMNVRYRDNRVLQNIQHFVGDAISAAELM